MASLIGAFVSANARLLRLFAGRRSRKALLVESKARILCLSPGGISEMVDTLPLLYGLRRHYPRALIAVACDPRVAPIAQACKAVNVVIAYRRSAIPGLGALKNAMRLQGFDWVLAAAPNFDWRLAVLSRLTNAAIRIGFERRADRPSQYYSDPIALPGNSDEEHRIETLIRLLKPLGLLNPTGWGVDLSVRLPESALEFAREILAEPPFATSASFVLINLTSAFRHRFREEDFIALAGRILGSTNFAIGLIAAPADVQVVREMAMCMGSERITVMDAISPIELAALLKYASLLITPQGETAHLAAATGTPALILWLKGSFKKSRSRGRNHHFVHVEPGERTLSEERVWQALQSILTSKKDGVEKQWANLLELPPSPGFMP
jgi:ADP-heptose:LPS heptosyltransferase